nr:TonB-dependent receptor [Prevotella corporis]
MSTLAFYAEERLRLPVARHTFEVNGGVRVSQMLNLPTTYTMRGQWYADPRVNLGWSFPQFHIGKWATNIRLQGGVGQHTKFPTMDYIYPDPRYLDIIQLSYYSPNEALRTINVRTFVLDVANKNIQPAITLNGKWEQI